MNAPLSRFLVEFSEVKPPEPVECFDLEPEEVEPTVTLTLDAIEQRLDEARREAAEAERTTVEAELTGRFETEKAEMLAAFEAARENWANDEGQRLSASLTAAVVQLEAELSTCLANALQPLFSQAVQARMLAELGHALATILGDPSHPPIRIEGPVDLLTAFGTAHPTDIAIDYVVSDQPELTITTDTTRIETRLSACLSALQPLEG